MAHEAKAGAHEGPLHVLVMAKSPVPGRVKTRLCPPCSPEEAADVATAALADTLAAVAACNADYKVVALDGPIGEWLPPGIDVVAQRGEGFDERLAHAWEATWSRTRGWGLQIGMDTPQVTAGELNDLLHVLAVERGAVLGRAIDGGWWLIGLPGTAPQAVFRGITMSTATTSRQQAERLRSLGLEVIPAGHHRDIDTLADLRAVVGAFPSTITAAVGGRVLIDLGARSRAPIGT